MGRVESVRLPISKAQVLNSAEPVVVDFWAEWCGPCKMIAPALWKRSPARWAGKVKIVKLNVDEKPGDRRQVRHHVDPDPDCCSRRASLASRQVGARGRSRSSRAWINSSTAA